MVGLVELFGNAALGARLGANPDPALTKTTAPQINQNPLQAIGYKFTEAAPVYLPGLKVTHDIIGASEATPTNQKAEGIAKEAGKGVAEYQKAARETLGTLKSNMDLANVSAADAGFSFNPPNNNETTLALGLIGGGFIGGNGMDVEVAQSASTVIADLLGKPKISPAAANALVQDLLRSKASPQEGALMPGQSSPTAATPLEKNILAAMEQQKLQIKELAVFCIGIINEQPGHDQNFDNLVKINKFAEEAIISNNLVKNEYTPPEITVSAEDVLNHDLGIERMRLVEGDKIPDASSFALMFEEKRHQEWREKQLGGAPNRPNTGIGGPGLGGIAA